MIHTVHDAATCATFTLCVDEFHHSCTEFDLSTYLPISPIHSPFSQYPTISEFNHHQIITIDSIDLAIFSQKNPGHFSMFIVKIQVQIRITNITRRLNCLNGGFRSHGGTPSHHPNFRGIFPYKPSSYWGTSIY